MGVGGLSSVRMSAGRLIRVYKEWVVYQNNKAVSIYEMNRGNQEVIENLKNSISSWNIKNYMSAQNLDRQSISKDIKKIFAKNVTAVTKVTYCNNNSKKSLLAQISNFKTFDE
ncbi:hypothetical protein BC629DRAFT_1434459 [Irpex lacteus]|nr:hypothetical protein BC629DRAFT_1434459 [Irpex lacteus]